MATAQQNLERFQMIADRGLQDRLDADRRARFDMAVDRGLIKIAQQAAPTQKPTQSDTIDFSGGLIETGFTPATAKDIGLTPEQAALVPEPESGTDFPEEPETTRAARELPEIGTAGLFAGENLPTSTMASLATAALTTTNEQELGEILKSASPSIGIVTDPGGNLIAVNNKTGVSAILNKPGISRIDLLRGLGLAAAFTPAGRAAGAGTTGAGLTAGVVGRRAAQGALASGATEAAIQAQQESAGGEFNIEDVGLSTALGGAAEPIAEVAKFAARPIVDAIKPQLELTGDALKAVLDKGKVLTSDLFPPKTAIGGAIQKIGERIPIVGTGGVRAGQQQEREAAVRALADDFGIDSTNAINDEIVSSASRIFNQAQEKGFRLRNEARDTLNKASQFIKLKTPEANNAINAEIRKQRALGTSGDPALIQQLENLKTELKGGFDSIINQRTALNQKAFSTSQGNSVITQGNEASLQNVSNAISKDLNNFASDIKESATTLGIINNVLKDIGGPRISKDEARLAASKWKASNRIISENFKKAEKTKIKDILTKGALTPEIAESIIKGGKTSELKRLFNNVDPAGREALKSNVIKLALERQKGFPDNIDPSAFLNTMNSANFKKATEAFFKGTSKKEIDGLKKFLEITKRAQDSAADIASNQSVTGATLLGAGAAGGAAAIPIATVGGVSARAFESKPVRDLLIKLSNVKIGTKAEKILTEKIRALTVASGREETE